MTFDMKGSTIKRKVRFNGANKQFWLRKLDQKKVMKDLNYVEINKDCGYTLMELTQEQNTKLNNIINIDSLFLQSQGLMDYSLLLVIEETSKSFAFDSDIVKSMLSSSVKKSVKRPTSQDNQHIFF